MRILLTTTSYQDTPGIHHEMLNNCGHEIVRARGPLSETQLLELLEEHQGFDGLLNGDDAITAKFIDAAMNAPTPLKVIGKYGIGLDSIDVEYATKVGLPVLFTPGVNHTTVAEHAIGLMIAITKHFWIHLNACKHGQWTRVTGNELFGKKLGVIGMGRIGKAVIERAKVFGMDLIGYNRHWDESFAKQYGIEKASSIDDVLCNADIISLHMSLCDQTRGLIDKNAIAKMKNGVYIINTARGGLVVEEDIAEACKSGKIAGYATDVLAKEPMKSDHIFKGVDNIIMTPHVGSRTSESVQRQAVRATKNVLNYLEGKDDYIQANK